MGEALYQLWVSFAAFAGQLGALLALLGWNLLPWLPGGLWCAWWLWCANWKHAWPVLRRGGWVGVVLVVLASALAWSGTFPGSHFGLPNFWGQLLACTLLALAALFCGWAQGKLGWTPAEVSFEPPPAEHGHHAHH